MKVNLYPITSILILLFVATAFVPATTYAQQLGLANSNFAGTHSLYTNPSAIADSRHAFYLNLVSVEAGGTNDFYRYEGPVSIFRLFKDGMPFKEEYLKENLNGKPKLMNAATDVRGPSFMLRLSSGTSIGFTSRVRAAFQVNNLSEDVARLIRIRNGNADDMINQVSDNNTFNLNTNVYSEMGFSFAQVLVDQGKHFIKAGATVKKLSGAYSAYAINEDTKYRIEKIPTTGEGFDYSVKLDNIRTKYGYMTNDVLGDRQPADLLRLLTGSDSPGKGWGADLGLTYEFRPGIDKYTSVMDGKEVLDKERNKYKFRIGVALMDMGSINYSNPDYVRGYSLDKQNKELNMWEFEDAESLDEIYEIFNESLGITDADRVTSFRSGLPTALNINIDYKVAGPLYLNATMIKDMRELNAIGMRQNSLVALTPRLEFKKFEASLPIALQNNNSVMTVGAMVRLGNFFIGSDNIGGAFNYGDPYGANLYMGVTLLPILKRNKKDRDKDGVSNAKDKCKKEPGTLETWGCPDRDNDGVADKDDACPDIPGSVENKGCPVATGSGAAI